MELSNNIKENLVELAKKSTDQTLLKELSENVNTMVRREVARNHFTPSDILDVLATDCVANVSYMAVQNPHCNIQRDISDSSHPCVSCTRNAMKLDCNSCKSLSSYQLAS